jgi:16S rRNA (uracil1498-N3)-methyltransferase
MLPKREHRFFVGSELREGQRLELDRGRSRQVTSVFRLGRGDRLILFDGSAYDFVARIVRPGKSRVEVEIESRQYGRSMPAPTIELGMSLIKGDRFDLVVQKATELGVARVQPLVTARTVVSLSVGRAEQRVERWRRIAIEAAEQSGRSTLPEILEPRQIDEELSADGGVLTFLLSEAERRSMLAHVFVPDVQRLRLLVGPEGGFTDDEVRRATACGALAVTLGPLILRAETAAIAAIAGIQALAASSKGRCASETV